jgi:hypothetical protein
MSFNIKRIAGFAAFISSLPVALGLMMLIKNMKDHQEKIDEGYRWE